MMKICQIISTPPFAWATGGCARVVYDLSWELAKRGHDVTIITTDLYEPYHRYPTDLVVSDPKNLIILRFPYFCDWLAWKKKIFISLDLIKYLRLHVRDYDIIHLQDLISVTAIFTSFFCKHYNMPYFLTTHGSIPWLYQKKLLNSLFKHFFGEKILKQATKILVLNRTEFELCKNIGIPASRIHLIPNGVNLNDYQNLPIKGQFREKFYINPDTEILLYVGRLYDRKGLDLLINAFDKVQKEYPTLKLVFVGPDDGYQNKLKEIASELKIYDKVIFCGFLSDEEKIGAYIDSDIFITPLFYGFPITFIEACLFGKPIITTDKGDRLDWIDGQVGYSTEYDVYSIEKALTDILSNPQLYNKFSENGKLLVKNRFNWSIITDEIEEMYNSIHISDGGK